jgi:hypothetical protein
VVTAPVAVALAGTPAVVTEAPPASVRKGGKGRKGPKGAKAKAKA